MNLKAGQETLNLISTIRTMIGNSCIIDFGIVQSVPYEGLVNVSVAVAKTKQDMQVMTCVLANPASSSLTTYIKPNEGDRVIVLYPRLFDAKMFTVEEAKKKEVIVNAEARGYNLISGIAILMNQFKEASHKNLLKLDDGKVTLKLAYDKNNDKNLLTLETDENGAIHLDSNEGKFKFDVNNVTEGEDKGISTKVTCNDATAEINKDSEITVANKKASAKIDKDGAVTITSNTSTKINIDKDGNITLEAGGKVSIKNSAMDLKSVIEGLADEVNALITVGSPATQSTSPATQTKIATWKTSKLNQLLQ